MRLGKNKNFEIIDGHNQTFSTKQLALDCCVILETEIKKNFQDKFLTGQSKEAIAIKSNTNNVIFIHNPQKYDTAFFIKKKIIVREAGSYAQDLQKHGSRFLVYKKKKDVKLRKNKNPSRKWLNSNYDKTMIQRGNHRFYFTSALGTMSRYLRSLGGEVEWYIH